MKYFLLILLKGGLTSGDFKGLETSISSQLLKSWVSDKKSKIY